jgi:hypothetical protein
MVGMRNADTPQPTSGRAGRPHGQRIEVWLTPDEKRALADRAAQAGLSASAFLRTAGLNQPIRAKADVDAAAQLVKVAADLGRFGGLLKLWLSERRDQGAPAVRVSHVLDETRSLQQRMLQLAMQAASR